MFLSNPDEDGEIKRARVVEMTGDYEKILEKDKDHAHALQDLQYRVVYDRPSHQKEPKSNKCKSPAEKQDEPYYDFDKNNHLLTYNEVLRFMNKQVTDKDGEY